MVDGYRKVYHDRSYTYLHFRGKWIIYVGGSLTIACTLGGGLYLLKDNKRNKKETR